MKPHALFLRLRKADTKISDDRRSLAPDAALWRTFLTTLSEADIVVVRAEVPKMTHLGFSSSRGERRL
jgi:hypothetical protein